MNLAGIKQRLLELIDIVKTTRGLRAFTFVLLAVDGVFIVLYAVTRAMRAKGIDPGLLAHDDLRITTEGSYPEIFNYGKFALIVILLARLAWSTRQPVYHALAWVFLLILFDDSLAIHEAAGERLSQVLALRPVLGLRAEDLGEVLAWGLFGVIAISILAWGFWRSDRLHAAIGGALLLPLGALIVFGVGVDMLYGVFSDAFPGAGLLLDTTEDGGEMVSTTVECALVLAASRYLSVDDSNG